LLDHLDTLWDGCMDAFSQRRTARRAKRLGLSQVACLGRHTLTGVLSTCGREFEDWSADYRFFSQDRWEPRDLFRPVLGGVVEHLASDDAVVAGIDDTGLRKTGTRTPGVAYRRDPLSPAFHVNFIRAQRFLQCSAMLPTQALPAGARGIPIRYEHVPPIPKPKKSAPPEAWKAYTARQRVENLSTRAVEVLHSVRQELDERHHANGRTLVVGVDGGYTNKMVLKGLPPRTTLIGRVRKDAELFYPPQAQDQPRVGTKRTYGNPAPRPETLRQDETVPWQEVRAFAAGQVRTFRVKTVGPVLWKKAGADRPLRLVVIAPVGYRLRQGSKLLYRQPAFLICTDPNLPLEKVLQYYVWRWEVEVNHRDEKQLIGVGQAQVRSPRSVDRQPAFAVANYAMLLLAGVRTFGTEATQGTLPPPKWRAKRAKERITTQDLIQQLRYELWAYAMDLFGDDSDRFTTMSKPTQKPSESPWPLSPAVLYAQAG
jgi:hypothetical protein